MRIAVLCDTHFRNLLGMLFDLLTHEVCFRQMIFSEWRIKWILVQFKS